MRSTVTSAFVFALACASVGCSSKSASSSATARAPAIVAAPPPRSIVAGCPPAGPNDPPIRFGDVAMISLCRDLYVEPSLTADEQRKKADDYAGARADVEKKLGPYEGGKPRVVLCKTAACRVYFAGTFERSWALGPGERLPGASFTAPKDRLSLVVVRFGEGTRGVIAHEMIHAELHHRFGEARVPTWFHEGIAALYGGEPVCDKELPRGVDDLRRLERNDAWADYTNARGTIGPTYCQARAEVAAWVDKHGGEGVLDLVKRVRGGARFEDVYGPLLTQSNGEIPTLLVSTSSVLGAGVKPFSILFWMKPAKARGVLAHVSTTDVGTGGCNPILGFDGAEHLVAQLIHGDTPALTSFARAVDRKPRALGAWTHVAMTWAPGSPVRLYVDGELAGESDALARYDDFGDRVFVAWGSSNAGGAECWAGAIVPSRFDGAMTGMSIYAKELGATEVAAAARARP